jgi:hypothetical protein
MTAKASTKSGLARQQPCQCLEACGAMITSFINDAKETNMTPRELELLIVKYRKHRKHLKHHKKCGGGAVIYDIVKTISPTAPHTLVLGIVFTL